MIKSSRGVIQVLNPRLKLFNATRFIIPHDENIAICNHKIMKSILNTDDIMESNSQRSNFFFIWKTLSELHGTITLRKMAQDPDFQNVMYSCETLVSSVEYIRKLHTDEPEDIDEPFHMEFIATDKLPEPFMLNSFYQDFYKEIWNTPKMKYGCIQAGNKSVQLVYNEKSMI